MSNAPSKPVSFSRPKVGYFSNRPRNPARRFNSDETGIAIVEHKHTKILGLKGERQISSVKSADWESLVTVANSMISSGHIIPPLPLFPRKCMNPELMNGTPP